MTPSEELLDIVNNGRGMTSAEVIAESALVDAKGEGIGILRQLSEAGHIQHQGGRYYPKDMELKGPKAPVDQGELEEPAAAPQEADMARPKSDGKPTGKRRGRPPGSGKKQKAAEAPKPTPTTTFAVMIDGLRNEARQLRAKADKIDAAADALADLDVR